MVKKKKRKPRKNIVSNAGANQDSLHHVKAVSY